MEVIKQSPKALQKAVLLLKRGGIIICPTDTVYGFLADASNKKAVAKIYNIKKRPKSKPLSVFVRDIKMAGELAEIDARRLKMLRKYWPGKVTVVLKRKPDLKLYGLKKESVAIRIPNHQFLQKIFKKINRPLVQTSVNISTQKPLNNIDDILSTFQSAPSHAEGRSNLISLVIDGGDIKSAKPSKIIDLSQEKLRRLR